MYDQVYAANAGLDAADRFKPTHGRSPGGETFRPARSSPFSKHGRLMSGPCSALKTKGWVAASMRICSGYKQALGRLQRPDPESVGQTSRLSMKWVTREKVKVDRVACPWLIRKFIDPLAEFLLVLGDQVMDVAKREGATPYDVKGVEFGHHGNKCSFDALVKKHGLTHDPAIVLLAKIVNGADTDNTLWNQPEAAGLNAIAEGFRHLGFKDYYEMIAAETIVYDALYGYCQEMVRRGKPDGQFR